MATYTAVKAGATYVARSNVGETFVEESFTFTVAPALNDVVQMFKIPAGAKVCEVVLSSTDIDTNGTPLVTLDVGDANSATRFISASQIGRTGGVARLDQFAGLGYTYTADDIIQVKVSAAPATSVVGTVVVTVFYTMDAL